MKLNLEGKVAIVTGGSSGIGAGAAKALAEAGARVVIGDVRDGASLARDIGGRFVETDVRDPDAVDRLVGSAVGAFGHLDVVFNNAGIEFHGPLAAVAPEDHRRMVDINLNGVFFVLQSSIRAMLANPGPSRGAIVNTASVAGLMGVPGMSTYNATKGAVVLLTRNAAVEYGPLGIRVNAICPGIIRTPMALAAVRELGGDAYLTEMGRKAHPIGRVGEIEDVANLVLFLSSEASSFISGAAIPIDGAMTAGFANTAGFDPATAR